MSTFNSNSSRFEAAALGVMPLLDALFCLFAISPPEMVKSPPAVTGPSVDLNVVQVVSAWDDAESKQASATAPILVRLLSGNRVMVDESEIEPGGNIAQAVAKLNPDHTRRILIVTPEDRELKQILVQLQAAGGEAGLLVNKDDQRMTDDNQR